MKVRVRPGLVPAAKMEEHTLCLQGGYPVLLSGRLGASTFPTLCNEKVW